MSGGFFRGTSADQDTRFSNKQAKLMKSQKFPPELDHLVDASKVKMDVIKPWIANRVTELLGFEDEVLINFIYGLLDGKDINGKEVQIQITGFMEKNTGKFMKELWGLLLSAQKNASGVPQQFLDAKEEEIRKKKVETDRIANEIQKKKEFEQEKKKKMDDEVDVSRAADDASKPVSEHLLTGVHTAQPEEEKEPGERNGLRGRNRSSRSPYSGERSASADRITHSRSTSKSFSNSRSYSDDRHKSKSMSRSPQSREMLISPYRRPRSPPKRSLSPRRKYSPRKPRSPLRRRSPYSRRRSSSYSRRRSPSPRRHRSPSPVLRRSPPLRRRRSPTPVRHKSPSIVRRRSPSPLRRRSPPPMRRRSPSPLRRRSPSPVRRRSSIPIRRRSPTPSRYRSPSPRWRSPSPPRRRSPSPVRRRSPPRSPKQRRGSPLHSPKRRNRSGSSYRSRSPVFRRRRSLSRDHDVRNNGVGSKRTHGKKSPLQFPEREGVEHSGHRSKGPDPVTNQPPISLRSPQRDPRDRSIARQKVPVFSPSRENSRSQSGSSLHTGKSSPSDDRRTPSVSDDTTRKTRERVTHADGGSPVRQTRDLVTLHDSTVMGRQDGTHRARGDGRQRTESPQRKIRHSPTARGRRNIPTKGSHHEGYSPEGLAGRQLGESQHHLDDIELRMKDRDKKSEKASMRIDRPVSPTQLPRVTVEVEYRPGRIEAERLSPDNAPDEHPSAKHRNSPSTKKLYSREDYKLGEKRSRSRNVVDSVLGIKTEPVRKSMKRVDSNNRTATIDSDSEIEKNKSKGTERRKHKRHEIASDDDTSYDSHIDERKDAKRRKKEEKKLRKEERRRRREERHRRREDRRAAKIKAKSMDTVTPPSDLEKNQSDADDSDDHIAAKINSHPSDTEETESEQKKLEIELRKKALESLRAKKASNP